MAKEVIAAGGLVFNERNELLLIFRRGKWDLPKGKVDDDESVETAAVREVMEETGLKDIQLNEKVGITFHGYVEGKVNILKETHWFKMTVNSIQPLIPQTEEDIEDIRWVNNTEIKQYLENTYQNIVEIITKAGFL